MAGFFAEFLRTAFNLGKAHKSHDVSTSLQDNLQINMDHKWLSKISPTNGPTERIPKKPEYLISRSQLTHGSVGKVPFNCWWKLSNRIWHQKNMWCDNFTWKEENIEKQVYIDPASTLKIWEIINICLHFMENKQVLYVFACSLTQSALLAVSACWCLIIEHVVVVLFVPYFSPNFGVFLLWTNKYSNPKGTFEW